MFQSTLCASILFLETPRLALADLSRRQAWIKNEPHHKGKLLEQGNGIMFNYESAAGVTKL